jgi:hypothetical protein
MPESVRIRASVGGNELEIEGTEDFVGKFDDTLQVLLKRLREGAALAASKAGGLQMTPQSMTAQGEFGEQLQGLSGKATDTDRLLLAGLFVQTGSSDNTFSTRSANALLLEQSIKIGNPSQSMANNLKAKRVFRVGKAFRVSKQGEEHLKGLAA